MHHSLSVCLCHSFVCIKFFTFSLPKRLSFFLFKLSNPATSQSWSNQTDSISCPAFTRRLDLLLNLSNELIEWAYGASWEAVIAGHSLAHCAYSVYIPSPHCTCVCVCVKMLITARHLFPFSMCFQITFPFIYFAANLFYFLLLLTFFIFPCKNRANERFQLPPFTEFENASMLCVDVKHSRTMLIAYCPFTCRDLTRTRSVWFINLVCILINSKTPILNMNHRNSESVDNSTEQLNNVGAATPSNEPGAVQPLEPIPSIDDSPSVPNTNQNSITTSTLISQFQKKSSKPVSLLSRRRQSLQFPSFHRNLMKRQSEQNLQTNIAENQAKVS